MFGGNYFGQPYFGQGFAGSTGTVKTKTQTAIARITGTTTKTQLGKASILNTTTKTQTGVAKISITTVKTITGISRITAVTLKLQTAISRITGFTTKIQTGIANVSGTTLKTQTGKANIGQTVTQKTQPAKVRIVHGNTTYSNAVMTDAPISYWRLGESSTTIPNGTVLDNTGYSLATSTGTPTLSVAGALAGDPDTATSFDGASTSYWAVLDAANYRYSNAAGQNWSIELWLKSGNASQQKDIYVKKVDANNYFQIAQGGTAANGDLYVNFVDVLNGGATITVSGLFTDLKYHHVVCVADRSGSPHTLKVYIDGHLYQSSTCNGGNLSGSANLQFGQGIINTGYWNGTYDEVSFYGVGSSGSGVLSPSRILAHHNAALATTTKTQIGVARIQVTTTKTQTSMARITAVTTKTQTSVARITAKTTRVQTGVARITVLTQKTQIGIALITGITAKTQTGKGRVTASTSRLQLGVARITMQSNKTQAGVTRVTAVTTKTQLAKANVYGTTSRIQTGKGSIVSSAATSRTITGVARIQVTTLRVQTGVARIMIITSKTQTAVSRIAITTTKTLTGKANLRSNTTRQILGLARVTNKTSKTITGVASIALPVSARSLYTNKEIGQATWNSPDPSNPTSYQ